MGCAPLRHLLGLVLFVPVGAEWAARHFGTYWDEEDKSSRAAQQAGGIQFIQADAKFIADFKARTAPVEAAWVKDAEAKGLANAAAVLAEFRAEIGKVR